jgi:putative salt-induced outer membrane protein
MAASVRPPILTECGAMPLFLILWIDPRSRCMKTLTVALMMALTAPVFAQQTPEKDDDRGWDGTGEVGYVSSSGNSRSDSANAKLGFTFEDDDWKHEFSASGFRQRGEVVELTDPDDPDSGERVLKVSANRYELGGSTARKLDERNRLYTSLRYENDDFAPYDYQATVSVGWGHQLIDTDTTELYFEAGPGYKRTKDAVTEESNGSFIGRGKMEFETKITDNTSLVDTLLVESGNDNTFAQNDLAVKVAMNERFAIKAGLQHRHNTDVPATRKKTDRLTTVNLVYDF